MSVLVVEMDHVVAQHKRTVETIVATHHCDVRFGYQYTVSIHGGKFHGIEFHCSTEKSALWLFDQIVTARKNDIDWSWLTMGHETYDSAGDAQ